MKRFQENRHVLGSDALLTLVLDDSSDHEAIFRELWKRIDDFDKRFSRFIVTSELSKFNNKAGELFPITPDFKDFLVITKEMSRDTKGLFNPFILPGLQRAGYKGSWPTPESFDPKLDYAARQTLVAATSLKIDDHTAKIPANSAIDSGGIGKGYLLDQLAKYLEDREILNYWLSLGGDIIASGHDIDNEAWLIQVQHATAPDQLVGVITNEKRRLAIATSGITKRKGENWHHIIDPKTGRSALTDILTVSLVAEDATTADVYAKCVVILGSKKADEFISSKGIKIAYIQTVDGKVYCFGQGLKTLA